MGTPDADEVMRSGVYRIDLGNGWFYLGSAYDLREREGRHRRELGRGVHCNKIMQRAFDKYGAFKFVVLGRYPIDVLLQREQELLDAHCGQQKCANIALLAGNPMAGLKHSDAARAKIRATHIGKKKSPEHRAKLSAYQTGKKASDDARANMSVAKKGHTVSPATRAKISAAKTGVKRSVEARAAISAGSMGRKMPPFTTEHRANISLAATARWARWRKAQAAA